MFSFLAFCILAVINVKSDEEALIDELFPHYPFECDPDGQAYETWFSFLQGLGHGFVHAEPKRIFFEYYFPAQHWVGFASADQIIEDDADHCSTCYFNNYYPLQSNKNHSNLYPKCIEECLDDTIFVATVNSDEINKNNWNFIEFQIAAQKSKKWGEKKMYRIPKFTEILELWGSEQYPYRESADFESDIFVVGHGDDQKKYIHARFWRQYDFKQSTNDDAVNEWVPFAKSPEGQDLYYPDSLCFISIASFYGGGFYIDTQHLANIHCFKLNDIKVDCEQLVNGNDTDIDIDTDGILTGDDDTDIDTDPDTDTDTDTNIEIEDDDTDSDIEQHQLEEKNEESTDKPTSKPTVELLTYHYLKIQNQKQINY